MISLISGKIIKKIKQQVIILTAGGVGYTVMVSPKTLLELPIGSEQTLETYLKVSDSSLELFGFQAEGERFFFEELLSVSGVGPKTAMSILSLGSIDKMKQAIARGDVKYLTAVQGMGKKTAERLVVELKGKMAILGDGDSSPVQDGVMGEVIEALFSLGYDKDEAKQAVEQIEGEGRSTEELLREALKNLR